MQIIAGKTDVSISIYARALSGAPLTGKVAADFALSYRRAGANVPLSLSNLASVDAAHTDGGLYEVGNGEYRLDLPDAACATGANQVSVTGTVDGGVLLGYPIQLDAERTPGGSHAQTVTVTCGVVAVQDATVQILDAADDSVIDTGTTNSSGVVVVRCNALSVKITAVKAGYASYTSAAITVTGAAARSVTLTAMGTVPAPTVAGTVTAYGYCQAYGCAPKSGVLVDLQQTAAGTRQIYDDAVQTLTSNALGLVSAPVWADGSLYRVRRGTDGAWSAEFAPTADVVGGTSYLLPGFLGHE
jgi:hypothetical protein